MQITDHRRLASQLRLLTNDAGKASSKDVSALTRLSYIARVGCDDGIRTRDLFIDNDNPSTSTRVAQIDTGKAVNSGVFIKQVDNRYPSTRAV